MDQFEKDLEQCKKVLGKCGTIVKNISPIPFDKNTFIDKILGYGLLGIIKITATIILAVILLIIFL